MKTKHWKRLGNRATEDECLLSYWQAVGGHIYAEVPVGQSGTDRPWPKGSKIRRIDGVRLTASKALTGSAALKTFGPDWEDEFRSALHSATVEIIEVKPKLNRPVIGQAIAGSEMFEIEYGVAPTEETIVYRSGDPALELVCSRLGISLHQVGKVV